MGSPANVVIHEAARALALLDLSVAHETHGTFAEWINNRKLPSSARQKLLGTFGNIGILDVEGIEPVLTESAREQLWGTSVRSKRAMARHEWFQQKLWIEVDSALRGLAIPLQQDHTLANDEERLSTLLAAMSHADIGLSASLATLPWPTGTQLWDIAGGSGHLSIGIARNFDPMEFEVVVIDHPAAADAVRSEVSKHRGGSVRCKFIASDVLAEMSSSLPGLDPPNGVFLFSRCLHNFSPGAQDELLWAAWRASEASLRIMVVNPSWDWDVATGGVWNPGVAIFGFYMAVNAVGGGVPRRSVLAERLGRLGTVVRDQLTDTLDLFSIGASPKSLEGWEVDHNHRKSMDFPATAEDDLERIFDAFVPAALLTTISDWKLDEFTSMPRTLGQLEKYLGLPTAVAESVMGGIVALGWCRRDEHGRFLWTIARLTVDDRVLLSRFRNAWRMLAADVPNSMSSSSAREIMMFL
ncbi:hypothetical protein [Streptomyces sp. NPDC059466]|uniref:hypothetical protein n=1 Tax=unclassified Streptomyces TaxID=2593676 RepID=UPI00369D6B9C